MHRRRCLLALSCLVPISAHAQDTTAASSPAPLVSISLAEALQQARAHSPAYRQTLNNADPARWGTRSAYASLFPSVTASSDLGYTGSGQSVLGGGVTVPTSPFLTSGYSLGLQWELSGRSITAPAQQKALERATDEDISGAGVALTADISIQYLDALETTAQVQVARQQVKRNEDFLELARARHQVGQATLLDVRQAEVAKGTSDVALLRANQAEYEAKIELLRRMGVELPTPIDRIALSDSFPVSEPKYQLDSLLALAEQFNPQLRSLKAREHAADLDVRAAKSDFLPSLSVRAGWSGFTQQFTNENLLMQQSLSQAQGQAADCHFDNSVKSALSLGGEVPNCDAAFGLEDGGATFLPPVSQQIQEQNNVFPFHYTRQPFGATLSLTLPIFTGFSRSLRLSQARAQQDDADEDVRARRFAVRSEVRARHLGVETSYQVIGVQAASREAARDQLRLAQERYRVGAGTALEVSDAQAAVQRAEGDYVTAVYDYHKAIAALEAAVGRSLR